MGLHINKAVSLADLKMFHVSVLVQVIMFFFLPVFYFHQVQDLFSQENRQDPIQKLISGIAVSSDLENLWLTTRAD